MAISGSADGDDLPNALHALRTLSSVVKDGMPRGEYERRVLETKTVVNRYVARPDTDGRSLAVVRARGLYITAAAAWPFSVAGGDLPSANPDCPPASDYLRFVFEDSPARVPGRAPALIRGSYKRAVPIYWSCASTWIRAAEGGPEPRWPARP